MKPCVWISMLLLLGAGLSRCKKQDGPGSWPLYSAHYISYYADPPTQDKVEAAIISTGTKNCLNPWLLYFGYKNQVSPESIYNSYLGDYHTKEDEARKAVFDSLALAHHDTEYKRKGEIFTDCLFIRTECIDIFSDTDYDATHPAGTPLNDIVDIRFSSAEDYLLSNYTRGKYLGQTTVGLIYDVSSGDYRPTDDISYLQESLEEFNRIKRKLISFNFSFVFRSAPTQTAKHRFTVVYENAQGLYLSGQTRPVLLQCSE